MAFLFFFLSKRIAISFVADFPVINILFALCELVTGLLRRADRRFFHWGTELEAKNFQ